MSFSTGAYAKITNKTYDSTKETLSFSVTSMPKPKEGKTSYGFYTKYARFRGKAFDKCFDATDGQRIKILECSVQNCYAKDGKVNFLQYPSYTIFDCDLLDENGNVIEYKPRPTALEKLDETPDMEDLPF